MTKQERAIISEIVNRSNGLTEDLTERQDAERKVTVANVEDANAITGTLNALLDGQVRV